MKNQKRNLTKLLGLFIVILSSLVLVGCELSDYQQEQVMKNRAEISQQEAEEIALAEVPGTVVHTTIDDEDLAKIVYSVTIDTGTNRQEVSVDADTGDIIEIEIDDDYVPAASDSTPQVTENNPTSEIISQKEAEEIALAQVSGSVIRTEFDGDDYPQTYEVTIQTSTTIQDVTIDAKTGQIIGVEQEID